MKKTIMTLITAAMIIPLVGCSLTPSQGKVVAKNAGLASAVTWIAYDNPSAEEVTLVKGIIGVLKGVTADTSEGATYTQILYPVVEDYVEDAIEDGTIKPNEKALVLTGSLALLNGIDLLFATNPEWGENTEFAREILNVFLTGAETGLALADDDPRMVSARQSHAKRARVFKKEVE